ncbi:MAG TPA: glycosyltransferase, partial [Bacteroidota bacterium]|nr:glycosyltransferase [Bacteroidota bacterium]
VQELNNQILIKDNFKTKYNLQHKHFALVNSNFVSGSNTASLIKTFINEPGDFDIVIIGNKISGKEEYFDYCNEIARYDDRITIIPGLPPDEVNEAIKEADLLLIPSLGESAGPLALLQAMHFKTPWIATPYCNSALDEAGGIIAELKDFPKYVRALLDNPQIANDLGELGYQHQQRTFSFEKSIDAFVSLIEGKNEIPDFKMPNEIRNEQNVISQKIKQLANYPQYQSEEYVFSIIIPTFNRSDVLMMCLDAINKQTFPHNKFEVIVIDDGSTDDTEQKTRNFPNTFKLTYIKQKNSGPGPARNKGILFAKGEYSLILNDDAIMDPYNLEAHFMSHLTKYNGQKVAVIGKFDYSEEFIERPFVWLTQNTNVIFSYNSLEPNKPFDYKYFWTCNISLKTTAIIEAGLFDENFSEPMMEDTELGYRLQMMGYNVYFEPESKSTHYHWIDVPGFVKRQKMNGRNVLKFLMKYPHTLYSEKNVFGINALDASGIAEMRFRHTSMADDAINMTRLLSEIDNKLKIKVEESYITLPDKSILELEEFKEQMKNAAYFLHNYNYLSGILDQLEKQNFDLTYIRKPLSGPERILEKFVKYSEIEENITSINNINENNYTNEFADNDYLNILQDDYKPNYVVVEKSNNLSDINKNIKILFTMYGWDEEGGGTQLPRSIAIELSKSRFDVAVFYAAGKHPTNNDPYYLEEKNFNGIHLYGVYNRPTVFLDEANPRREVRDDKVVELFNYVLDKEQPNIMHFHNFLGLSFAIAEVAKSRNIPTLFTPHNYHLIDPELYMFDMENQFKKWKNIDFFENSILPKKHPDLITDYKIRRQSARNLLANQIDYVLAISQREANILAEFSEQSDNIYVVNQVSKICDELIRTDHRHPLHNPIRFGFIGSILIHKGIHIIYQASEMLKNEPVEFYLYGMGSPDLINALSKSFPNSKVIYKGAYTENDLVNIAKEIDAIIIPSIWEEGGPLTAPESIAMGLPIIGANIGGIPDFVQDGVNGLLYQYDNPASLAEKIQQIIDNNDLIMKFKDNLKLSFTFQDYISHISLIYQNITNKKHLRREDIELRFNQISIPSNSFIISNNEVKIPLENNHNSIIYKPLMLHLGSQGVVLDGFENLDAQPQSSKEIQCDVRQLPYSNESVDMILAIDLLQVYSHRETDAVLKEWVRVLKKGGSMVLSVPDLKRILNDYYSGNLPISEANQYIFGKQANDYDYHYNGFDDMSLQKHLQSAGLQIVELQHEANSMPRLIVRAVKI